MRVNSLVPSILFCILVSLIHTQNVIGNENEFEEPPSNLYYGVRTNKIRNRNVQFPTAQFNGNIKAISTISPHEHIPKIEKISTQCSASGETIDISVDFTLPFDGIVYSKGYFADPNCRFVEANTNSKQISFRVPVNGCGTLRQNITKSLTNVIVFQMDESVQEAWDVAKRVSCSYATDSNKHGKMVVFKPLSVKMLDVTHHQIKSEAIDCWMDIQKGAFPNTSPIAGQIAIGEELSVLIYLKDEERIYDVSVKDCWAFNTNSFEDPDASKVQLTGYDGCPRKTKLIGRWQKTQETGDTGATTIAFTNMTAFKFPDSENVHLTCNIELCRGLCEEEVCLSNSGSLYPSTTSKPIRISTTFQTTIKNTFQTTTQIPSRKTEKAPLFDQTAPSQYYERTTTKIPQYEKTTIRQNYDTSTAQTPRYVFSTNKVSYTERTTTPKVQTEQTTKSTYYENTSTQTPKYQPTTTSRKEYQRPSTIPSEYQEKTTRIPQTTQNFIRTTNIPYTTLKNEEIKKIVTTTRAPICYPGSFDPRCPTRATPTTTEFPNFCFPGSTSPDCLQFPINTNPTQNYYQSTTTETSTLKNIDSEVGESESIGKYTTKSYYQPDKTTSVTTNDYEFTTKKPLCYPGQIDPRCPPECTKGSTDRRCFSQDNINLKTTTLSSIRETTKKLETFREEKTRPTELFTTTRKYETTTRVVQKENKPLCYPGTIDPRCPPVCTIGSTNKRCVSENETQSTPKIKIPETTTRKYFETTPLVQQTTKETQCYPGTIDPRCPPTCYEGSSDKRCPQAAKITTTRQPYTQPTTIRTPATTIKTYATRPTETTTTTFSCFPGSIDERCPPVCFEGSSDKRCPQRERTTTREPYKQYTTTEKYVTKQPVYETTTNRVEVTNKPVLCYPGQIDPRCPPSCEEGSKDVRCQKIGTTNQVLDYTTTARYFTPTTSREIYTPTTYLTPSSERYSESTKSYDKTTTPKEIITQKTTKKPLCYPGQIDPRCPPICTEGSTDKRCGGNLSTTSNAPTKAYEEYTTQKPTFTTKEGIFTTQNSLKTTTVLIDSTTKKYPYFPTTSTQKEVREEYTTIKYPKYPTTEKVTEVPYKSSYYSTLATTTQSFLSTTRKVVCYPGQIDPRCPPICTEGSTDRRCPKNDAFEKIKDTYEEEVSSTSRPVLCYPGQVDPRCPMICTEGSRDVRCTNYNKKRDTEEQLKCFTDSQDPRCPRRF